MGHFYYRPLDFSSAKDVEMLKAIRKKIFVDQQKLPKKTVEVGARPEEKHFGLFDESDGNKLVAAVTCEVIEADSDLGQLRGFPPGSKMAFFSRMLADSSKEKKYPTVTFVFHTINFMLKTDPSITHCANELPYTPQLSLEKKYYGKIYGLKHMHSYPNPELDSDLPAERREVLAEEIKVLTVSRKTIMGKALQAIDNVPPAKSGRVITAPPSSLSTQAAMFQQEKAVRWSGTTYAAHSQQQYEDAIRAIEKWALGDKIQSIGDVGCGDGKVTQALSKKFQANVLGIDNDASMIAHANKNHANERISFEHCDARALDKTDEFDLITSFFALHWIKEKDVVIANMAKALKPGGIIKLLFTASTQEISEAFFALIKQDKWTAYFKDFNPGFYPCTAEEIESYLSKAELSGTQVNTQQTRRAFSQEAFKPFIKNFLPGANQLNNEELWDKFVDDFIKQYIQIVPLNEDNNVEYQVERIDVAASRPALESVAVLTLK